MKKEQILKERNCTAEQYKKVCNTLETPDAEDFPISKSPEFFMILEWFRENEKLSIKSAIARYKEFQAESNDVSPVIDEIAPLIDDAAYKILDSLAGVAQSENALLCNELRTALRARVYQLSQEPQYKESFAKFTEGITVDEVGKPYPELTMMEPSTILPPGLD
jgi:hypothetical protein